MKALLRGLLRLHLSQSAGLWLLTAGLTLVLGWGTLRVERALDLMSLLPADHPVVRANLEAGVGQQELLWLVAEGNEADLEARRAWAEGLVDRLLTKGGLPLNGLAAEGRLSDPVPVPGPEGAEPLAGPPGGGRHRRGRRGREPPHHRDPLRPGPGLAGGPPGALEGARRKCSGGCRPPPRPWPRRNPCPRPWPGWIPWASGTWPRRPARAWPRPRPWAGPSPCACGPATWRPRTAASSCCPWWRASRPPT